MKKLLLLIPLLLLSSCGKPQMSKNAKNTIYDIAEHMVLVEKDQSTDFNDLLFLGNYTGNLEIDDEGEFIVVQRVNTAKNQIAVVLIKYISISWLSPYQVDWLEVSYLESGETYGKYVMFENQIPDDITTNVLDINVSATTTKLKVLNYTDIKSFVDYYF